MALSTTGGDSFADVAAIETDAEGNFAYPTPVLGPTSDGSTTVLVGYSSWGNAQRQLTALVLARSSYVRSGVCPGEGVKLATVRLPGKLETKQQGGSASEPRPAEAD